MPDSEDALYLIAYDIADPKRLSRVHTALKKHGMPVQYSVFTVVMKRKTMQKMLEHINELINKREDDVRCYRLPGKPEIQVLGEEYFSKDVMLFTDGVNRILARHVKPAVTAIENE